MHFGAILIADFFPPTRNVILVGTTISSGHPKTRFSAQRCICPRGLGIRDKDRREDEEKREGEGQVKSRVSLLSDSAEVCIPAPDQTEGAGNRSVGTAPHSGAVQTDPRAHWQEAEWCKALKCKRMRGRLLSQGGWQRQQGQCENTPTERQRKSQEGD